MRRILGYIILLLLFSVGTAMAAGNFYWKDTFTGLDAIADSAGDRGVVIDSSGKLTFYYNAGAGWIPVDLIGGVNVFAEDLSPTDVKMYGGMMITTGPAAIVLPAAVPGMSICIVTDSAAEITIDCDGSDTFVMDGVTAAAGEYITNEDGEALGDWICVVATSAVIWQVMGKAGAWTEDTPP